MPSAEDGRTPLVVPPLAARRHIMGLTFRNVLGIAAGVDRTGENLQSLITFGCGHIEIGTVTDPADLRITARVRAAAGIVGLNVGSARPGFSELVAADYMSALFATLRWADYVVLNFSNTASERALTAGEACPILSAARAVIDGHALHGRRLPLLAKVNAGRAGDPLPISEIAGRILDGFVVSGESTERLSVIRRAFPRHGLISVGGIRNESDVQCRMAAGADLVQSHRAAVENEGAALSVILRGLQKVASDA